MEFIEQFKTELNQFVELLNNQKITGIYPKNFKKTYY
jgi:hypothetical protein